ncbi:MobA/MobL family protein [Bradyrhizobium sp. CCGUVB1N3]|uniref:MobA/MobL family protein n=1 Tax=Bradyrhizobium sp. CCGUVB1N3 TaxID=2949629 RepID=UPI0020B36763|nr:MobA/MobL family protein [Bradyrhizobium sp. CCGUVB1N3]MCP3476049.1 MobA/MobL family protein [Bradyrhizobium sp. CCGUVB1N3]
MRFAGFRLTRAALGKTDECQPPWTPARPERGRASTVVSEASAAIYHLRVKNVSRRDGRSAVAAAAYRAGETLATETEEKDSAFGGRRDAVFIEIRLPAGAPAWMTDRARAESAFGRCDVRRGGRSAMQACSGDAREAVKKQSEGSLRQKARSLGVGLGHRH